MSKIDDLLEYIFAGKRPVFYGEMAQWIRESRRFMTFADNYRSKIRAKMRNAGSDERMDDVRAELLVAACLLRDRQFVLEYEKYSAWKQRGPDFTVTFKTHTPFNVEVRRLRRAEMDDGDVNARLTKLITVLCDKVGQMPPSIVNLLWLNAEREVTEDDVTHAVRTLLQLAEHKDEDYFTRRGFESAAAFLKQYQRLSGIVVRQPDAIALWANPLARHKLPPEIANAIRKISG